MRTKVGIGPKSLCYGFLNEIVDLHVEMGVPKFVGSDVPNSMKDIRNFVNNVPRVQKCIPKWGSAPNHFLMGF